MTGRARAATLPAVLRFIRLFGLAALLTFALASPAQAQPVVGGSSCLGYCLRAPGGYVTTGLAMWPRATGIAFTVGAFHHRLLGVELAASVPLTGTVEQEGTLGSSVLGRLTLLRETLGAPEKGARAPTAQLLVSLRAGFAMLFANEASMAFAIGPSADVVLFGALLVTLRPLVALRLDPEAPSGTVGLKPFPLVELSLGVVASDSCLGGSCGG